MSKAIILVVLLLIVFAGTGLLAVKKPQLNQLFNSQPTPATLATPSVSTSTSAPTLLTPQPDSTITGPLVIKGYVPKSWTFEGQFRAKLLDDKRQLIMQGRVPVEWDNENTKDTLYFVESYNYHTTAKSGFLVLESDNPSGLLENQKSMEITVIFTISSSGTVYLFDQRSGNAEIDNECQVVLPRAVNIGVTKTPIKDTINLLARRMHPDFYIKSVNLNHGLLTIEFPEINGFTTGGSCAQGINAAKVIKTAMQFPEVKQVKIIPDSIFQP